MNPELLSQMYFWLPNHRIVRTRLDLSDAFSHSVAVQDASVYGTSTGFRGTAHPGSSFSVDNSWEYSLTRSWVLATDITYRNDANALVTGSYAKGRPSLSTPAGVTPGVSPPPSNKAGSPGSGCSSAFGSFRRDETPATPSPRRSP
jgi:hypothetical protein